MRRVLILAALVALLGTALPQAQADIIIENTWDDLLSELPTYNWTPAYLDWAPDADATVDADGWRSKVNAGGPDLVLGASAGPGAKQNRCYVLTAAVDTLRITLQNVSGSDSNTKGDLGSTWCWYDSTDFVGSTGTAGKHTMYGVSIPDRPAVAAGTSANWDIPLSLLDTGGQTFGDAGDALGYFKLNAPMPYTGIPVGDLRITDVRLVPEPTAMGLLILGSAGLASLKARRRRQK